MGQMPVLEVDGRRVHQSLAMCRYVAKQIGVAGKDAFEDLQIDAIVDTINEFRLSELIILHFNSLNLKSFLISCRDCNCFL